MALKLNASELSNYYNKSQVDTQFSNLINSAPEALNTLFELSNALNNDANYATTIQNQIDEQSFRDFYNMKIQNSYNISSPRTVRLGIKFDF